MLNLREALHGGLRVVGTWLKSATPEHVELLGVAGFDFVVLDTLHAAYPVHACEDLVRAADAANLPTLVRVAGVGAADVGRVLDAGTQGVIVPNVTSAEEATAAARAARYPPAGERGGSPTVRATRYGGVPWQEHIARAAGDVVVVQVEAEAALQGLDAILAVPGVDVVFIGAFDLALSLGVPGRPEDPLVLEAGGDVAQRALARGVHVGIWMPSPAALRPWAERGVQLLTVSNTFSMFLESARDLAGRAREATA